MSDIEFEITFSDITIIEGKGKYEDVAKIMSGEFAADKEWMLRTRCTLITTAGISELLLHFYSDKKVYIIEYIPSIKDVFYNPDIQCLNLWLQDNGWGIPRPSKDLINTDKGLWKHFWEIYLVDSEYFDQLYGERENIYLSDNEYKEEDDESGEV
jgi:hypothetical protein